MINREISLLSEEVKNLLVNQLAHELKNYNLYKSFANYFGVTGLTYLEKYYNLRAEEEKEHSEWIHDYLSNADCQFMYPCVEENTYQITSLLDPFLHTVEREIETTNLIYTIYEKCFEIKDYMTCSWLYEKLIKEQIEEENTSRMAQSIMELDDDLVIKSKRILGLLNPDRIFGLYDKSKAISD